MRMNEGCIGTDDEIRRGAKAYLESHEGYEIVDEDVLGDGITIDFVIEDADAETVIFVFVDGVGDYFPTPTKVTQKQREAIEMAAFLWLDGHARYDGTWRMRFDSVGVKPFNDKKNAMIKHHVGVNSDVF